MIDPSTERAFESTSTCFRVRALALASGPISQWSEADFSSLVWRGPHYNVLVPKGWFTRTTQAQAQLSTSIKATCEPGRRKHKRKRALRFLALVLVSSKFTRGLSPGQTDATCWCNIVVVCTFGNHVAQCCQCAYFVCRSQVNAQLSFHGHRDSVKFFVAVPGSVKRVSAASKQSNSPQTSASSSPEKARKMMLVLSGGEGYVDFRLGDGEETALEEQGGDLIAVTAKSQSTNLRSHIMVWQVAVNWVLPRPPGRAPGLVRVVQRPMGLIQNCKNLLHFQRTAWIPTKQSQNLSSRSENCNFGRESVCYSETIC